MQRLLEVYAGHFKVTLSRYLAYRVELVIWLFSMVLRPVVFLVVWSSAARALGGRLRGFSPEEFAAYFIVSMMVYHLTFAWVMFEWEPRVKMGELSYMLLRPSHVIHRDLGENLAFKVATFPVMLLTAWGLVYAFGPDLSIEPSTLLLALPALVLAWALHFAVSWTVAMGAFYTTQVDSINVALFFLMLLFSGQMGPIALMPPLVALIAKLLPFWWFMGFPVELLLGRIPLSEALFGLGVQAAWLAVSLVALREVWRRGLRVYTAVGI